jgi:phosphoribosylaminoimidazole (AIR) synthetase
MGVGMLLVVEADAAPDVLGRSAHEAYRIGEVTTGSGVAVV